MRQPYAKDTKEVLETYHVNQNDGLSTEEARKRIEEYGTNELEEPDSISLAEIIWNNTNNIIIYLLLGASLLSFLMNDPIEGIAILFAVLIAVGFGVVSEYQAASSVEALLELVESEAIVVRDGKRETIPSSEIVPGDILYLTSGNTISADGRIIESTNFASMESSLTGESEPIEKTADTLEDDGEIALGDQVNSVFSGTAVTRGSAYAVVTATGMDTEIGRISELMTEGETTQTPLNQELDQLGKLMVLLAFVAAIMVIIIGLVQGTELSAIAQIAIILAISAIPEALPAVSTITLARGMRKMADHQTMVKNLASVETLGSTDIISSDKTGTLTENQMTVEKIYLTNGNQYDVSGTGYFIDGEVSLDGKTVDINEDNDLHEFMIAALLSSESELKEGIEINEILGDPTDGSLVVLGHKLGMSREKMEEEEYAMEMKVPFDSKNKYMMTTYEENGNHHIFIKGAPDVLVAMDRNKERFDQFETINENFAEEGLRVLAVGHLPHYEGEHTQQAIEEVVQEVGIDVLGLVGIIDPPREDVIGSVAAVQNAGMQVKMITGDHPKTASVIAKEIGIKHYENTITGREIDELIENNPEAFDERIKNIAVFARVSPENKLQIVNSFQKQDQTVAMTGDGVNDAPALKGADIGVAMGIRGTEVAKDASDMILMNDKFTSIVEAIEEGRVIFSNIKKFVYFLFTCNMIEIISIIMALLFFLPSPLQPLHILWLNLVVDSFPAVSLAFEKGEGDIMNQPPRDENERLVNVKFVRKIAISGLFIGLGSFLVFAYFMNQYNHVELAQTAAFASMGFGQVIHIGNARKEKGFGFLPSNFAENKYLLGALAISIALIFVAIYAPFFSTIFQTVPLTFTHWLIILGQVAISTVLVYITKRLLPN